MTNKIESKLAQDAYRPEKRNRFLDDGKTLRIAGRFNTPGSNTSPLLKKLGSSVFGPANYSLPSTIGFVNNDLTIEQKPAFSISHKLPNLNKNCSPGPIYNPKYPENLTGFAITGKLKEKVIPVTPGPGAYEPERFPDFSKNRSISCYIGHRRKSLEGQHQVGPNQYNVSNNFGYNSCLSRIKNSPSFKFNPRRNTTQNQSYTAGIKTEYHPNFDSVSRGVPKWSILGRNFLPQVKNNNPGPNAYRPELAKIPYKNAPRISIGVKYSDFCSTGYMTQENAEY